MAFASLDSGDDDAPLTDINMVPLIDVMLVLLIIFIVTAPLLTHAVKVDLPKAASTANQTRPDNVQLAIDAGGQLFWCRVSGRALDPRQPHAEGIWSFEDLSPRPALRVELTPREREIAALLIEGLTSKLIGRRLAISPRTVDIYRGRLMRKHGAATTAELVKRLLEA